MRGATSGGVVSGVGAGRPGARDYAEARGRAGLGRAVWVALAECDAVVKMAGASWAERAALFGMNVPRIGWLMLDVARDDEQCDNMVT